MHASTLMKNRCERLTCLCSVLEMVSFTPLIEMFKLPSFEIIHTPEDEIDFDAFLKFSNFCFNLLFLDFKPLSQNANWQEKVRHAVKITFVCFTIICCFAGMAMQVAYSLFFAPDFMKASINFLNVISNVLVIFKTWPSLRHRGDIWKLI